MDRKLGRLLLAAGFILLIVLFAWESFAGEPQVIEVRRNIPLADDEPVYKDFYLNVGSDNGLKTNQIVTALRKFNIKDSTGTQSFGEVKIPVGQLKVLFVTNRMAIAREHNKVLSRQDYPMLEQTAIMSGDLIELKGTYISRATTPPSPQITTNTNTSTPQAGGTAPPLPNGSTTNITPDNSLNSVTAQQTAVDSVAQALERVANQSE